MPDLSERREDMNAVSLENLKVTVASLSLLPKSGFIFPSARHLIDFDLVENPAWG